MTLDNRNDFGKMLKLQRLSIPLTLRKLANESGMSASHIARVERGERFPSGRILHRLSKPLGFEENELFMLAGYLSQQPPTEANNHQSYSLHKKVDPYVAAVLSHEPMAIQRTIIAILSILKTMAESITQENSRNDTTIQKRPRVRTPRLRISAKH